MVDRQLCPYCNRPIRLNNWRRHVEACAKRPNDEDLVDLWFSCGNMTKVASACGVDPTTARRWYREAGIDTSNPPIPWAPPPKPPLAGPEFAPRLGAKRDGCDGCPDHFECRRRMRMDLWPLCCIPSQHEVAWAYIDGRIGFDGRLPAWLPELMEVING